MVSLAPRSEHLTSTISFDHTVCRPPYHAQAVPAVSLNPCAGAPKASPPARGDSVVGAALIWMARHWKQTCAGRILARGRLATHARGNWPRIIVERGVNRRNVVGRWLLEDTKDLKDFVGR